ncbi:response regulator transcription factor [Serratia sp. IR-2025]
MIDKRSQAIDVLHLIELALAMRENFNDVVECCYCATGLTPREHQVLHSMAAEIAPAGVAKLLQLSPKTVSAHKRAAMRKLGFKYNHELYHWLRKGGLGSIRNS